MAAQPAVGPEAERPIRMRVGEEVRSWEEGRVNLLDDSFEHEVLQLCGS